MADETSPGLDAAAFKAPSPTERVPSSPGTPATGLKSSQPEHLSWMASIRHLLDRDPKPATDPLTKEKTGPAHAAVLSRADKKAEAGMEDDPMARIERRFQARNAPEETVDLSREATRKRVAVKNNTAATILAGDGRMDLPNEVPFAEGTGKGNRLTDMLSRAFHSRRTKAGGIILGVTGGLGLSQAPAFGAEQQGVSTETAAVALVGVDSSVTTIDGTQLATSTDGNLAALAGSLVTSGVNLEGSRLHVVAPAGSDAASKLELVTAVGVPAAGSDAVDLLNGGRIVVTGETGLDAGSADVIINGAFFEDSDKIPADQQPALEAAGDNVTRIVMIATEGDQSLTVLTGAEGQETIVDRMAGESVIFEVARGPGDAGNNTGEAATPAPAPVEAGGTGGTPVSDGNVEGMSSHPIPAQAEVPTAMVNSDGVGPEPPLVSRTEGGDGSGSTDGAEQEKSGEQVSAPDMKAPADITTTRENGEWHAVSSNTTVTLADGTKATYDQTTGVLTNAAGNIVDNVEATGFVKSLGSYDEATRAKLTSGEAVVVRVDGTNMVVDRNGNNVLTGEAASTNAATMKALRGQIDGGGGTTVTVTGTDSRDWKDVIEAGAEFDLSKLTSEQVAALFDSAPDSERRLSPVMPKLGPNGEIIPGAVNAVHETWPTVEGDNPVSIAVVGEAVNAADGTVHFGARVVMRVAGAAGQPIETMGLTLDQGFIKVDKHGDMIVDDEGNGRQTGFTGSGSSFFTDARVIEVGADAYVIFGLPGDGAGGGPGEVNGRICQFDAGTRGFIRQPNQGPGEGGRAFNWGEYAKGAGIGVCGEGSVAGQTGSETRESTSSARLIVVETPAMPDIPNTPELPRTGAGPLTAELAAAGLGITAAGVGMLEWVRRNKEGRLRRKMDKLYEKTHKKRRTADLYEKIGGEFMGNELEEEAEALRNEAEKLSVKAAKFAARIARLQPRKASAGGIDTSAGSEFIGESDNGAEAPSAEVIRLNPVGDQLKNAA